MKFEIYGKKVKITKPIESYIKEKVGKIDKYFENPDEVTANVSVKVRGIDQMIEVTIPTKYAILRAEESDKDLYAAIDIVSEKLERQIRKSKEKIKNKNLKKHFEGYKMDFEATKEEAKEKDSKPKIVRRKNVELKLTKEEEAILQMEMLGHDFFIFLHDKTDSVAVVYKRHDGDYGLITTADED